VGRDRPASGPCLDRKIGATARLRPRSTWRSARRQGAAPERWATFRIDVTFDHRDLRTMDEARSAPTGSPSTLRFTNSRIHDAGTTWSGP